MARSAEVLRVAAEEFGVPEATVGEVIRRIREEDMFVRETRSAKGPKLTCRHVANLTVALLAGVASRKAPDAVRRAAYADVDSYGIQKYWGVSNNYIMADDQWRRFFVDEEWAKTNAAHYQQAPLRDFTDKGWRERNREFNFVDAIEALINAFEREPSLVHDFGASDVRYFPDLNQGVVDFVRSRWDQEVNGYISADDKSSVEMEFSDEQNDFRAKIRRIVTIEVTSLQRLATALSRANREG